MCLKAENQWLKSCRPYSGRTAPQGVLPVQGLERSAPAAQSYTHTPPQWEQGSVEGRHTSSLHLSWDWHSSLSLRLSVFLSLPVWFSPLPCPLLLRFWPSAATEHKSLQFLELASSFTQTFRKRQKTSPSLSPSLSLSFSNAVWVAEASKLRSKGLEKHSGFF